MGILEPLPPPDRKDTLRAVGWTLALGVLAALALLRAKASDQDTVAGGAGVFVGAFTAPLLLAALGWLLVQRVIRKRRGFPPWVAAIAVGVSALGVLGNLGSRAQAVARAEACTVPRAPYGKAPAHWEYRHADAATRAEALKLLDLGDAARRTDVSLALRDGEGRGTVVAIPAGDTADFIRGAERGGREVGATIRRTSIGGTDLSLADHQDKAFASFGGKGCVVVAVYGVQRAEVDLLTRAIFAR